MSYRFRVERQMCDVWIVETTTDDVVHAITASVEFSKRGGTYRVVDHRIGREVLSAASNDRITYTTTI